MHREPPPSSAPQPVRQVVGVLGVVPIVAAPPPVRPPLGGQVRVPVVYDQVDGNLALEAADVALAEVVTQLVNLQSDCKI